MEVRSVTAEPSFQVQSRGRHRLIFLGIALFFTVLLAYELYTTLRTAQAAAATNVQNLALVLEAKLDADFQAAERAVSEMALNIPPQAMRSGMADRYGAQVNRNLKSRVRDISSASALRYFDAQGERLYTSIEGETAINIADRAFFLQMKGGDASATIFSEVVVGRFTKRVSMYVVKAIRDPDGVFLGLALTAIDLSTLSEQFGRIDLGRNGTVALRRLDSGASVVRYPGRVDVDNKPIPDLPIRNAILKGVPRGVLNIPSAVDGVQRIYGYRTVSVFPFYVAVAVADSDYLADWRKDAVYLLLGGLSFLALLAVAEARRNHSEIKLRDSEQRFRNLIARNNAVILQIDAQGGRILDANASACSFYGWSHAQLCAKTIDDVTAIDTQQLAAGRRVAATENRDYFIAPHRLANGETRTVEVHSTPIQQGSRAQLVAIVHDITEMKRLEAVREETLSRLQKIASRVPGLVYQYLLRPDGSSCFPFASDAIREIYRVSPQDVREDASKVFANFHPDDYDGIVDSMRQSARDLTPWVHEYRVRFEDGAVRWLLGNAVPQQDADGSILWHGFITDITQRRQAEEKIQLAANVFSHAREGITITDAHATIIDVNEAFTRITGYGREEVLGKNPRILKSGRQGKEFYEALWRDLLAVGHWSGEIWNRRKGGEEYAEMLTISAVRDDQGKTTQYVALFSDITSVKEHEQKLERIAHFDALTGLPNRVLLADRLHQAMAQAQRRGQRLAVAYIDLDGFKAINDKYGHEAGDQVLVALAACMKQALRDGDTLARLGGDEFVAVLLDLPDIETSIPSLSRLLAAAAQPVLLGEHALQVSASLGVTFYPQAQEADPDQLLRQADHAMYQAKLAGKNRYQVFERG